MLPSKKYQKIISKAYESFKKEPTIDWDYPEYGGNLSSSEIDYLSPEHVDAIQNAIATVASKNKMVSETQFQKLVSEKYQVITPVQFSALDKQVNAKGFYIEWFGDYHDIEDRVRDHVHYTKAGLKVKGEELNPEDFKLNYTGPKGGLTYPGLFWIEGQKPNKKELQKEFLDSAKEKGFSSVVPAKKNKYAPLI